ncbi:WXG100 family type VII secretion target [Spirillospora sp. CA-255316]
MSEYAIEPATIRSAAQELDGVQQRLNEQWSGLLSALRGMGQPWGADDIGVLIGDSYTAIEAKADECYRAMTEELAGFAQNLRVVADNHERAEEKSVGQVSSVYRV